jgi:hypothetical protein
MADAGTQKRLELQAVLEVKRKKLKFHENVS